MNQVLRHLRRAALLSAGEGPSDAQLLEAFISRRDEAAFEVLLRRHGPMVLGVCRRVLRNLHDAEDAFQATFLVLARQAGSIRSRQVVASWLYGVAYRTAMKARAMNAKRRVKERHAGTLPHTEASTVGADEVLLEQLDHELNRLPEKYRVPIVLCELQGRSRMDVARLLGVPEGTLSWRLAQAKKMLAKRLARHGVVLSVGALVAAMTETLSPTLRASTLKTVFSVGSLPSSVMALTEGVMKAMFLSKLKITFCAAALMLVAGIGATGLTYRATAQQPSVARGSATDELEAMRLEIEALRKSLQATRERVKSLEGEVSALKGQGHAPQGMAHGMMGGMAPGMGGGMMGRPGGGMMGMGGEQLGGQGGEKPAMSGGMMGIGGGQPGMTSGGKMPPRPGAGAGGMMRKEPGDPLGDAEAALKRLRKNPGDPKATEELERALKRLKEHKKPGAQGQGRPADKQVE